MIRWSESDTRISTISMGVVCDNWCVSRYLNVIVVLEMLFVLRCWSASLTVPAHILILYHMFFTRRVCNSGQKISIGNWFTEWLYCFSVNHLTRVSALDSKTIVGTLPNIPCALVVLNLFFTRFIVLAFFTIKNLYTVRRPSKHLFDIHYVNWLSCINFATFGTNVATLKS